MACGASPASPWFGGSFLAVLGPYYCVDFSVVAANGGYSLVAVHRLLFIEASLVVEHRF